jgi:hypothetical protein
LYNKTGTCFYYVELDTKEVRNVSNYQVLLVGIFIGIFLLYRVWKFLQTQRLKRQLYIAKRAEKEAEGILRDLGYEIIQSQKRTEIITVVDGEPYKNWVQADYIVVKDNKVYVVEVKTGEKATQITNSATRRQLLEYYYVYKPHGILLLDMEYGLIREVFFQPITDSLESPKSARLIPYYPIVIAFLLGGLVTLALLKGGVLQ